MQVSSVLWEILLPKPYHSKRRLVQSVVLALLCAIPLLGLFRIDLASASFRVLGHSISWDNYRFLSGLVLVLLSAPLLTYVTVGSVWCGWACPQNFLSEWADDLTQRWLGKRADVRVDGEGLVVAPIKNRLSHWLILGGLLFVAATLLGMVGLMNFYPPADIWAFVLGSAPRQANMAIMLGFTILLVFVDIAVVRYFFCDYACFYRMGQRLFQTGTALHIAYDVNRKDDCAKCHYCATVCPTRIQPNRIQAHDICIDCGECVDACQRLHDKSQESGLLRFSRGVSASPSPQGILTRIPLFRISVALVFLLGCALMGWGAWLQPHVDYAQQDAAQERLLQIAHVCQPRCAALQAQCRGDRLDRCYEAAACTCSCELERDPHNPQQATWEACVRLNQQHRQAWLVVHVPKEKAP